MNDNFLRIAKEAALEAGKIILNHLGRVHRKNIKGGDASNFATAADLESEEAIVKILTENFPDHNIIAEEKTRIKNGSEYTWAVDPIDGTFSFAHGIPYFSVSIGLLCNNEPVLGVINHVSGNNLFYAQKNKGAFLNGEKISVSAIDVLEASACGLDFGHRKTRNENMQSYITSLIGKIGYPYCVGSSVACQALVAQGILDTYVNVAWIWDFVAGTVIVREAGGKVTDFEGKELDWTKERLNIVASN